MNNNQEKKDKDNEQQERMKKIIDTMKKGLEKTHQKSNIPLSDAQILIIHQYEFLKTLQLELENSKNNSLKDKNQFLETILVIQRNQFQNNQEIRELVKEIKENNKQKTNNCSHDQVDNRTIQMFNTYLRQMRIMLI